RRLRERMRRRGEARRRFRSRQRGRGCVDATSMLRNSRGRISLRRGKSAGSGEAVDLVSPPPGRGNGPEAPTEVASGLGETHHLTNRRGVQAMIEIACPRCGAGGRVPRDRVNSRLVCKKCLQVFHLSPSHQAVMGEPPAPKEAQRERAPRERMELELGDLSGLAEKLAKIKLRDAKIVGTTAAVLLVVAFLWWLFSKPSVQKRSETLAAAIRNLNMDAAVGMALPGTEMEAMKWVGDVYKQY